MIINDIRTFIDEEKNKRHQTEGISVEELAVELGRSNSRTRANVRKWVSQGIMKQTGTQEFQGVDGRVYYRPVYQVVPHEAST